MIVYFYQNRIIMKSNGYDGNLFYLSKVYNLSSQSEVENQQDSRGYPKQCLSQDTILYYNSLNPEYFFVFSFSHLLANLFLAFCDTVFLGILFLEVSTQRSIFFVQVLMMSSKVNFNQMGFFLSGLIHASCHDI